jgi:flagellar hook-associated protein 3 FlgL
MLLAQSRRRLETARNTLAGAQGRASSGLRVAAPSDDPLAASLARREAARIARTEAGMRTSDAGRMDLDAADAALDQVGALLSRAREIAVSSATVTVGADERRGAAREIEHIREEIIALGNTEVAGRYVFGGNLDDAPPFDATGAYVGDGAVRELEVAPAVRLASGVSAITTFGVGTGTDVLATLETLRVALDADDVPTIGVSLDALTVATGQVLDARADLGASMNAFDVARAAAQRSHDRAVADRQRLVGVDPFDAYTELVRAERALEAAVQVAERLPPPGLVASRR